MNKCDVFKYVSRISLKLVAQYANKRQSPTLPTFAPTMKSCVEGLTCVINQMLYDCLIQRNARVYINPVLAFVLMNFDLYQSTVIIPVHLQPHCIAIHRLS